VIKRPGRLVLLGRSLSHTLSPRLQNAALRDAGIPLTYEVLDIPASALAATLNQLSREGAAGNVTVPYKETVAARCDHLSPLAQLARAVNTFWFERGEMSGDNTDVGGFDAAAASLVGETPRGLTVGLLGAGGAAAAVMVAAAHWADCRILVHNRHDERARALAARFPDRAVAVDLVTLARSADLVVNATPVGLRDDLQPMPIALLQESAMVLDLVYRPDETAWVRAARSAGHRATDGLPMLVEQAALAFERWFGMTPNREVMWSAVGGRERTSPIDQ
jgi:shikimate dehydrogenase